MSDRTVWWLSLLSWLAAVITFGVGTWIGLTTNPGVGAGLWVASAVLGLLPFASGRTRHSGWWAEPVDRR